MTNPPVRRPDDVFYFAYGSNLDVEQKEFRTGPIRESLRCRLRGFRFAFTKQGEDDQVFANIVPDEAAVVWGVVYRCTPDTLNRMDRYEGVGGGHYVRSEVRVLCDSGEEVNAVTYVAGSKFLCTGRYPRPEYVHRVINGARHHRLPEDYVREIQRAGGVET